jgi:hypothetical protein
MLMGTHSRSMLTGPVGLQPEVFALACVPDPGPLMSFASGVRGARQGFSLRVP